MIKEWLHKRRTRKLEELILNSIDICRKKCHLMPKFKLPENDNNTWEVYVYKLEENGSLFGKKTIHFKSIIKGRREAYCVARAKALQLDQSYPNYINIGIDWEINKIKA